MIRDYWTAYNSKRLKEKDDSGMSLHIRWDPLVWAATDKAIQGISWQAQMNRLNEAGHWTLVHSDAWPGNVLWMTTDQNNGKNDDGGNAADKSPIRLLDWEMTGLGSGPQDLGQYILANMEPSERRDCERELIEVYWKELTRLGVKDVTWGYCWHEYTVGGVERWLWLLVLLRTRQSA
jgi:hypothetical protein